MMTLVKSPLKTFLGGIHPADDGKILTLGKQKATIPLPKTVYLVMSQHIGAPAKPMVKKGDVVKKGQLVGEAQGFISAHVHASVSGKVIDVAPWPHPVTGIKCPAVIIENSGEDTWMEDMNVAADTDHLSSEEIRHRIHSAGIVGLGGATFPTHVKLTPPKDKMIDTFILPGTADVKVSVHDMLGRDVSVLVEGRRGAGVHEATFDGSGLSSGVYLCRLRVRPSDTRGDVVLANRMLLVR